jgi:hypothetical protein
MRATVRDGVPVLEPFGRLQAGAVGAVLAALNESLARSPATVLCDLKGLDYLSRRAVEQLLDMAKDRRPATCSRHGPRAPSSAASAPVGTCTRFSPRSSW